MTKRLSVALDEEFLTEVQKLSGARTKREAIEAALRAYVREERIKNLVRLAGSGIVDRDLEDLADYRELEAQKP